MRGGSRQVDMTVMIQERVGGPRESGPGCSDHEHGAMLEALEPSIEGSDAGAVKYE